MTITNTAAKPPMSSRDADPASLVACIVADGGHATADDCQDWITHCTSDVYAFTIWSAQIGITEIVHRCAIGRGWMRSPALPTSPMRSGVTLSSPSRAESPKMGWL